ncbi:hypothetical protein CCR97_04280 [Rhodoplanes elegans]|uniref:Uncharacterized protein n=1 Tax=Rhodoplanes elegans TaxID=29408 RepID=A0A327KH66_9BRAD|nr:hypothetical protein [Rhodoplanes elegans]MBK5957427.1 hypothetical protein [Rhodoplanes elegans]RAI37481.1 hypothetical protein CH338_16010 [Rhodoplanes elegans]
MPKPLVPAPTAFKAPIVIPRGHDHYWSVIRELDKAGEWTSGEVVALSNAHRASVHDFVGRLVRGGIARQVGGGRVPHYRLVKSPAATPRLRRDGTQAPPSAQQQLWTAIRHLGHFAYAELILAASTDELAVEEITTRTYIKRLVAAGYLMAVVPGGPKKPAVWKLRPGMNTGPKAPQVLRAHVVFDPNRGAVMGEAAAEEVSA